MTYLCDRKRNCNTSSWCGKECIRTFDESHAILTENHNNAIIKFHILDEKDMRNFGFTDKREGYWYKCIMLPEPVDNISFNIALNKTDSEDWRIDILDENFCQPYDYQFLISEYKNDDLKFAHVVKNIVDGIMKMYTTLGLISGWEEGDYI